MKRWLHKLSTTFFRPLEITWLPPWLRGPARLGLLYITSAVLLWWLWPYQPRVVLVAPETCRAVSGIGSVAACHFYGDDETKKEAGSTRTYITQLLQLWDFADTDPRYLGTCRAPLGSEFRVHFSPSGTHYVHFAEQRSVSSFPPVVGLRRVGLDGELAAFSCEGDDAFAYRSFGRMCFSPDGRKLVTCRYADCWLLDDMNSGRRAKRLENARAPLAFCSDARILATGFGDRGCLVSLWDVASGQRVLTINDPLALHKYPHSHRPDPACFSLAFSPDGQTLARVGVFPAGDGKLLWAGERRYDVRTGALIGSDMGVTFDGDQAGCTFTPGHAVFYESDGVRVVNLATGATRVRWRNSAPKSIETDWTELEGGRQRRNPSFTEDVLQIRAGGPDGRALVLCQNWRDRDSSAAGTSWYEVLWDKLRRQFSSGEGSLQAVTYVYHEDQWFSAKLSGWDFGCFLKDGQQLLTRSEDGKSVALWDLPLRKSWFPILAWAAVPPLLTVFAPRARQTWARVFSRG